MPALPIDVSDRIPEPTGELIHDRSYSVKAYREGDAALRIRGQVHDQKPPGLYIADDPEPMSVHLMVVDLVVAFPSLEITSAEVVMEVTPHGGCTSIESKYDQLVGISIARGFSRQVKDLFGGPRGCTHVGALLQAMAPVAIQSMWSMSAVNESASETPVDLATSRKQREQRMSVNKNTCHIWAEDGEQWGQVLAGEEIEVPLWAANRLIELGRDPQSWRDLSS